MVPGGTAPRDLFCSSLSGAREPLLLPVARVRSETQTINLDEPWNLSGRPVFVLGLKLTELQSNSGRSRPPSTVSNVAPKPSGPFSC